MKRSELKRTKPMARGTATLKSASPMRQVKPLAKSQGSLRQSKPKAAKPKRAAREGEDKDLMDLCRGQPCYLQVPGIFIHDVESVVACHSNQQQHGKGAHLKAHNRYTVPGCHLCHAEIDQGMRFTKAEKFSIWDRAFERWESDRARLLLR